MASASRAAGLEVVVWVLIYGGLLTLGLGYALWHQGTEWGVWVMAFGACDALAGVFLIWVRSRMRDPSAPERKSP